ncbi:uncharacterized protein LOC135961532 [Calliphora vicina]|uniref:uncharacterized protein LOC135961532 n=1 Tax=Calliphora vicina TaxID=7373 RepID=UPI00325C0112
MCNSNCLIILLLCCVLIKAHLITKFREKQAYKNVNFYKEFLKEIKKQQNYDGLIVVQQTMIQDPRVQMIYSLEEPKFIIENQTSFYYKEQYNSEIMAVVVMQYKFHSKLWQLFASTLNGMRQVRVLVICVDIGNLQQLQQDVLMECEKFKFTNVLLHFINSSTSEEPPLAYLQMLPYPMYHLKQKRIGQDKEQYFPTHWLNMQGKTLLTLPDQNVPRSMMYRDAKDQIQFSGFAAKLVLLFAEVFNATLEMPFLPKFKEVMHFSVLFNMTKHGELDIPMSEYPVFSGRVLKHLSYITEVSKWMVMIPCASRMKISQVYEVLLTPDLFSVILIFTITFSLVHTIIEKLFYNRMIWLNVLMSDKVIPGILGQSFALKTSRLISLRLIYILLFVMGLYNSTIFSAYLQTFITSPPYQRSITSFDDLRSKGKKILLNRLDIINMEGNGYQVIKHMEGTIEYTDNATLYSEYRKNFNTTYGYAVTTTLWQIFSNIQQYYADKVFCVTQDLSIRDVIPFGVPLGEHSPLKEPLNYVIHKMHAAGLLHAWRFQVYNDLLNLKMITLRDSSRIKTYDDLTEGDLLIVWLILIVGLLVSLMVFFVEIIVNCCMEYFQKKKVLIT